MTMPALSSKCCSVTKIMPGALGTPPCSNPSLLSALPCYWPLVRLTLNAKAAINRFRVSLKRMNYNALLQEASDENALRTVHNQANKLKLMVLTPLAHHLANLFSTPNKLSLCHFGQRVGTPVVRGVLDACPFE